MSPVWQGLAQELALWRQAGRIATFWWRDDDAGPLEPALERLLALRASLSLPLALAAIPAVTEPELAQRLAAEDEIVVLQHGWRHRNLAGAGRRKAEFGADRPVFERLSDVALGRAQLLAQFGERFLPVFVPPWNRIGDDLLPFLKNAGMVGLSRYRGRAKPSPAPGLTESNCHVDPVAWTGHRGFVGRAEAVRQMVGHLSARRTGAADPDEPTGILSHHRQFDAACWEFVENLLRMLRQCDEAHWLSARRMFSVAP
ncbi:MAG: hypothetical protein FJX68_04440 [Alphaproteobacteria bacterium]|nr:hypothetical protein [Alphaproteobacteria bacterium]